jgi:hypothetical protein
VVHVPVRDYRQSTSASASTHVQRLGSDAKSKAVTCASSQILGRRIGGEYMGPFPAFCVGPPAKP